MGDLVKDLLTEAEEVKRGGPLWGEGGTERKLKEAAARIIALEAEVAEKRKYLEETGAWRGFVAWTALRRAREEIGQ